MYYVRQLLAALLLLVLQPTFAMAVDGYDKWNHTRISIVAGDSISVGEDLGIYIWSEKRFAAVEIERLVKRGADIEIEVTEPKRNKYYIFEIATDDPGIDRLPEFDPGLPYPEILTPKLHMENDLLDARGNMVESGNALERGNRMERGNQLEHAPSFGDERLLQNEHLLYQGFQPSE